ncbi:MAG TPA: hypothetical protein VF804_10145 [Holophagaceae bacterium]
MRSRMLGVLLAGTALGLAGAEAPHPKLQQAAAFHPLLPTPSRAAAQGAYAARLALEASSPFRAIPFRCVGPMGQGGRVVALAVDDAAPEHWIVAFATGGLWATDDGGSTWTPRFDHAPADALGDVAVVWGPGGVPKVIWAGTGEANASRSSYDGAGLFKSTDGGQTWQAAGLADSHRIARVVVDRRNPEVVYVASEGPLYTEGGQRGIYKTTDGGRTWAQVLKAPTRTGAVDLLQDWKDPDTLYAALWEKDRKPWDFLESGPGSGIYKTTDGGRHWTRLAGGFPQGAEVGRIGLAQSRQDPRKLYAFLDNQTPLPKDEVDPYADPEALTPAKVAAMSEAELAKVDAKRLEAFLRRNGYDASVTAKVVQARLKAGTLTVKTLLGSLGDAEKALVEAHIVGAELYATEDGGATWHRANRDRLEGVTSTYGYYFGQVRVDPTDDRRVYLLGFPALASDDGGRTFHGINDRDWNVLHPDHHALWIDPRDGRRLVMGNDGGLNVSTNGGRTWRAVKNLPVGQFYSIATDRGQPYHLYGGLQDNGVRMGPATPLEPGQQQDGWKAIYDSDGGMVQADPRMNGLVYAEYQFGALARIDGGTPVSIRPRPKLGEPPYRFNWVTPFTLSPHSPEILYLGAQEVLRSLDEGATWTRISPDLTGAPKAGNVPWGTLTMVAESPKRFGLLYAGTDTGRVWVSRDGGYAWTRCEQGLPKDRWVTRIEPSSHDEGTVYATFSAYRNDASEALIYRSADYGATWASIRGNLPAENLNVVREDPVNADLLFAGSDLGLFATLDGGRRWEALGADLPHVPVHDLALQPQAHDLVVGTHGRSAWVAPIGILEGLTPALRAEPAHLFEPAKIQAQAWWAQDRPDWFPRREQAPVPVWFHLAQAGEATLTLADAKGVVQRQWTVAGQAGLNRVDWDLLVDPALRKGLPPGRRPFVLAGEYTLVLQASGKAQTVKVAVEPAPDVPSHDDDRPEPEAGR